MVNFVEKLSLYFLNLLNYLFMVQNLIKGPDTLATLVSKRSRGFLENYTIKYVEKECSYYNYHSEHRGRSVFSSELL